MGSQVCATGRAQAGKEQDEFKMISAPGRLRRRLSLPVLLLAAGGAAAQTVDAPSGAAGRYAILREGSNDTGCMLILNSAAKAKARGKASLAPGCRDQGIVIFDPSSWRLAAGRLVLTARKGHETHLDRQPDGTWKKDPKEGKTLSLKRL